MGWVSLTIAGALFEASYHVFAKLSADRGEGMSFFARVSGLTAVVLSAWCLARGVPQIKPGFFAAAGGTALINFIATFFYARALRRGDISLVLPFLSLTPLFLVFTSSWMRGERPGSAGFLGVLTITAGCLLMAWDLRLARNLSRATLTAVASMSFVALLFSVSSNLDKTMVELSDPLLGSAVVNGLLCAAFWAFGRLMGHGGGDDDAWVSLICCALCLAAGTYFLNRALTLQIVPYVNALKRLAVLFGAIYGWCFFRENFRVQRLAGMGLLTAGAVILSLAV